MLFVMIDRATVVQLNGEPTRIVALPAEWIRHDAVYVTMHHFQSIGRDTPRADVFDIFRRGFKAACEAGRTCQITMHPHIIGARSWIWIVEELTRLARRKGDCWFAINEDLARCAKANG